MFGCICDGSIENTASMRAELLSLWLWIFHRIDRNGFHFFFDASSSADHVWVEAAVVQYHEQNAEYERYDRQNAQWQKVQLFLHGGRWMQHIEHHAHHIFGKTNGIEYGVAVASLARFRQNVIEDEHEAED